MIWSEHPARVRVPATSANLGPGFDALGLALARYDRVEARVTVGGLDLSVSGDGEETAEAGERHLVVTAMRAAFDVLGGQPPGLALRCVNSIPHGRGLGSSAAAVVSGVLAARELVDGGAGLLPDDGVLALATDLEGHPDNVAACLAGGLTIAWRRGGAGDEGLAPGGLLPSADVIRGEPGAGRPGRGLPGESQLDRDEPADGGVTSGWNAREPKRRGGDWTEERTSELASAESDEGRSRLPSVAEASGPKIGVLKLAVLAGISAVACIAPTALATREARRVLPDTVPHADAAANAARSALLIAGLTADPSVLFDATEDFLHQRYRAPVMPETADLLGRLRRAGVAAVVSGAGPSVLALTMAGQLLGVEVVDSIARETGIPWLVNPLDVDRQGAATQPGPDAHLPDTRLGRSFNQAPGPGVPAGAFPQDRVARPATHGPLSRECRGLLWC